MRVARTAVRYSRSFSFHSLYNDSTMSKKVFVTRKIPAPAEEMLRGKGYEVTVSEKDGVLTREELGAALGKAPYDGVLCLLTDKINAEVFDASPSAKIFANYAVGFDNVDLVEAKKRGITITNTPGVLTDSVAEHTFGLLLALSCRIVEGDSYIRAGKYHGWEPELLLGLDLKGMTLGLVGAGRIGSRVAKHAAGFDMNVIYYDVVRNESFEKETGAKFFPVLEDVLKTADVVSIHVPLLPTTHHLINAERLALMKPTAFLLNTSRGAVVDENALVAALQKKIIRGAGLDVFEFEPKLAEGLAALPNVVLTPHIASATEHARSEMARIAAENLIAFFDGQKSPNAVA